MFGNRWFGAGFFGDRYYGQGGALAHQRGITHKPIRRLRQAPTPNTEGTWTKFSEFRVDMEVGVGLTVGQGKDPQAMLRWSDDRGHTYTQEHWRSAGRKGQYRYRVRWQRLGRAREQRVFQFVMTDPVKVRLLDGAYETA
jgi:hypothetical protein